jgi:GT2 family glycosyltransferase
VTNIVILVHDRPRLTLQTLETLVKNTSGEYRAIIVDDASGPETQAIIAEFVCPNIRFIRFNEPVGIVGALRNAGANSSEWTFGRGEWLYFSDNDVAFDAGWLEKMQKAMLFGAQILGGYRHPYHGVNQSMAAIEGGAFAAGDAMPISSEIQLTDAVAGYSMLMRWDTWDRYKPFAANAKGTGQSEDFEYCQRIIKDGGKVGYIHPPVLSHCGITNSDSKPATGAEHFLRREGIIYE